MTTKNKLSNVTVIFNYITESDYKAWKNKTEISVTILQTNDLSQYFKENICSNAFEAKCHYWHEDVPYSLSIVKQ
jgi:hypothetical protein